MKKAVLCFICIGILVSYRVLCKKKSDGKRERGKVYDRKGRIDTGGVRIGDKKTEGKAVQTDL